MKTFFVWLENERACFNVMKKMFSLFVPVESETMFNVDVELMKGENEILFPNNNMKSCEYNIDFLASNAKKDPDMKSELVSRLMPQVYKKAQIVHAMKPYVPYDAIFNCLMDMMMYAIEHFEEEKGSFLHYFRFLCSRAVKNVDWKVTKERLDFRKYLGRRLNLHDAAMVSSLSDSIRTGNEFSRLATKVDLLDFLQAQTPIHRQILILYLDDMTMKEISVALNIPYTTVVTSIHRLLEAFEKSGKTKDTSNKS